MKQGVDNMLKRLKALQQENEQLRAKIEKLYNCGQKLDWESEGEEE